MRTMKTMKASRGAASPGRAFVATALLFLVWASADAQPAKDETPPFRREMEVFGGGGFEFGNEGSTITVDGGVTAWRGRWGAGVWVSGLPNHFDYDGSVSPALRSRFALGGNGFCQVGVGYLHVFLGANPRVDSRLVRPVPYVEFLFGSRNRPGAWSIGGRLGGAVALQVVVLARLFRQGG